MKASYEGISDVSAIIDMTDPESRTRQSFFTDRDLVILPSEPRTRCRRWMACTSHACSWASEVLDVLEVPPGQDLVSR